MSDKPKSSSTPIIPIAGALFLGIVVGNIMSDGDKAAEKVKRDLEARVVAAEEAVAAAESRAADVLSGAEEAVAAAEAKAAEALANAEAAIASGSEETLAAAGEQIAALEAKLEEMMASADVDVEGDEAFAALNNRVQVLAEQMAGIIGMVRSGEAAPAAMGGTETAAAPAAEAPAETAEATGGDADALAEAIGESGLALAVGESGDAGDARVFMARVDSEAGAARVMVVGEGPSLLQANGPVVELQNGCALSLKGVADHRAYIAVACQES
jgi:hypothetical protein